MVLGRTHTRPGCLVPCRARLSPPAHAHAPTGLHSHCIEHSEPEQAYVIDVTVSDYTHCPNLYKHGSPSVSTSLISTLRQAGRLQRLVVG